MKKYYVVAKKWDSEREAQVKYIAGEFTDYVCASLFRDAYNEHYSAKAIVLDEFDLINA